MSKETRRGEKGVGLMSCSKSTLCSREEESWWPMFVQLVYFSRPRLLRKACSSSLLAYKHTNILLFAFKEKGVGGDQHWICMRMRSPQEETSLLIKGLGRPAAFVPTPACQYSKARRAPHSGLTRPRPTVFSSTLTTLGPYLRAAYYLQHQPAEQVC